MNVLAIENVKREIDKRPEKVKPMTMIVVLVYLRHYYILL